MMNWESIGQVMYIAPFIVLFAYICFHEGFWWTCKLSLVVAFSCLWIIAAVDLTKGNSIIVLWWES